MNETRFAVGLHDTRDRLCWLAGYESDPTRYYSAKHALTFSSVGRANAAIERAKATHPLRERSYVVVPTNDPKFIDSLQ